MTERHSQSPELGQAVQLNAGETLDSDDMNDDALDSGYIAPDRPSELTREELRGEESLDDRLREEEPEDGRGDVDSTRAGRLVAEDEGTHEDQEAASVAEDVGIDGGAATAEEAAIHVQEPPD